MNVTYKARPALVSLGLTLLICLPAAGQNLVKDGDFEQAKNGTTANGNDVYFTSNFPFDNYWSIEGEAGISNNSEFVYAGNKSLLLNFGPGGGTKVSQTLATVPNQTYMLSFYANDNSNSPLSVMFGNAAVGGGLLSIPQNGYPNSDPNSNAGLFTFYSFDLTASSASTLLSFTASYPSNMDPGLRLDNIRVVPNAPVPEASTTVSFSLLLMLGTGCLIASREKRTAV